MFAAEFEPAETNGRRRSPRAPVSLDAQLGRGGLGRALCKVVDISVHGCRLHTYTGLAKGQTIWLTLPRLGHIAADVMWADDFTAGCQFQTHLTPAQFDTILAIEV
ncbi:MAG TPA: PilZ domain-containing protein [Sphingomonas sp.]|jgi:hypothetical protein